MALRKPYLRYQTDSEYREVVKARSLARYEANKEDLKTYMKLQHKKRNDGKIRARYPTRKLQQMRSSKYGCTITLEEYKFLNSLYCYYCEGNLPEAGVGLDRIDNTKGYDYNNVLPCCSDCNRMRGNRYTVEETKYMITSLKQFRIENSSMKARA